MSLEIKTLIGSIIRNYISRARTLVVRMTQEADGTILFYLTSISSQASIMMEDTVSTAISSNLSTSIKIISSSSGATYFSHWSPIPNMKWGCRLKMSWAGAVSHETWCSAPGPEVMYPRSYLLKLSVMTFPVIRYHFGNIPPANTYLIISDLKMSSIELGLVSDKASPNNCTSFLLFLVIFIVHVMVSKWNDECKLN